MENIKKFDIKSFLIGVLLMGWVMLVLVYFMYTRIQEVHQMVPKITYDTKWKWLFDYSWWKDSTYYDSDKIRIFDKNKLTTIRKWIAQVNNQLFIRTKNIRKSEFENILKNIVKEDFYILDFKEEWKYWLVDFNSDNAPKREIEKIFNMPFDVKYREVILPEYFNNSDIWKVEFSKFELN